MNRRSRSSQRWLARQHRDPFARRATAQGQVSRAHFKLAQLDRRFRLLRPGLRVLELGAAPGGWTRYLEERLSGGLLVACDPRPVSAGVDTVVIEAAYGGPAADRQLAAILQEHGADLVLSDMAPNMTGNRTTDQARAMQLADLALEAAQRWLKPGGSLVVKLFEGEGVDAWMKELRRQFASARRVKPEASRSESREVYAVARGFAPAEGAAPAGESPGPRGAGGRPARGPGSRSGAAQFHGL